MPLRMTEFAYHTASTYAMLCSLYAILVLRYVCTLEHEHQESRLATVTRAHKNAYV